MHSDGEMQQTCHTPQESLVISPIILVVCMYL